MTTNPSGRTAMTKLTDEDLFNPVFWQRLTRDVNPFGTDEFLQLVSDETGISLERLKRRWRLFLRGEIAENIPPGTRTLN